jgi:hypothetical protein
MNGGKRGARRHYDYLHDVPSTGLPYYSKPRVKKEVVDPHPDSLIVKIKVKSGSKSNIRYFSPSKSDDKLILVPYGNSHRIGATLEEFEDSNDTPILIEVKIPKKRGRKPKYRPPAPSNENKALSVSDPIDVMSDDDLEDEG